MDYNRQIRKIQLKSFQNHTHINEKAFGLIGLSELDKHSPICEFRYLTTQKVPPLHRGGNY